MINSMPNATNFIIKQRFLFPKIRALGYIHNPGYCHGIAVMAMTEFLKGRLELFLQHLDDIANLSDGNIKSILNSQLNQIIPLKNGRQVPAYQLLGTLDTLVLYQHPMEYPHVFAKGARLNQTENPALYLLPERQRPLPVANFSNAFNLRELTPYLALLKAHFSIPVSFILSSFNHSIQLCFDKKNNTWILIDANHLPFIKTNDDIDMAWEIMEAFNPRHQGAVHAIFQTQIFVMPEHVNTARRCFVQLQSNLQWNLLHEITTEKTTRVDAFDSNWLLVAAQNGQARTFDALRQKYANLDHANDQEITALHIASQNGYITIVQLLIQSKVDLNSRDELNKTAIQIAVEFNYIHIVKLLLDASAEVNTADHRGRSPLHQAILVGNPDMAKLLIASGVDVNAADHSGNTPLMLACQSSRHEGMFAILFRHGAKPSIKNRSGKTASAIAKANDNLAFFRALTQYKKENGTTSSHHSPSIFSKKVSQAVESLKGKLTKARL